LWRLRYKKIIIPTPSGLVRGHQTISVLCTQEERTRRAIAEAKHWSQWPVIGWETKIYYLKLLRASAGTLSRWSRLHLQSLAPILVSRRVVKIIADSLSQHDEKHVVPTPLNGIRVGGRVLKKKSEVRNSIKKAVLMLDQISS
jgi:hypothetical protein